MKFWAIICVVLMTLSVLLEMLTPTMGGFSLVALAFAVGSVLLGFKESDSFGYLMIGLNLLLGPTIVYFGFQLMKKSPLLHEEVLESGSHSSPDSPKLAGLAGMQGLALTPLRPGGTALIGELRVNVMTEGKFVEANAPVRVILVEGSRVLVEPV